MLSRANAASGEPTCIARGVVKSMPISSGAITSLPPTSWFVPSSIGAASMGQNLGSEIADEAGLMPQELSEVGIREGVRDSSHPG